MSHFIWIYAVFKFNYFHFGALRLNNMFSFFQYKPFIYKDLVSNNGTSPEYRYRGFCIDLFDRIASVLDFTYEIYETPDSFFGSLNNDGNWNGAINELMEKVRDPLSLSLSHE